MLLACNPAPPARLDARGPVAYIRARSNLFTPVQLASMQTILVVDDSSIMRRMVMAALATVENVRFDQAETGLQAIERLAVSPVDLMVLDLNMPDVHGLEVLKFVRAHKAFQEIPVIVLTTRGDEESRAAALEQGATLYMTKPFAPGDLVPNVRRLLREG